jgi:NHL repeat
LTIGNLFLKMSYPPYQKRNMVTINYCCRKFEKIYHPNFNHLKKIVRFFLIVYSLSVFSQNCVTTYAGNGLPNLINGDLHIAQFNSPTGICRDRLGNIFIADGANQVIRKIDASGNVSTYAGTGIMGFRDGPSDSAQFNSPFDLCADESGNIYVSDFENQRIRKIDRTGYVTTVAGTGTIGYVDGSCSSAQFNYPRGIVWVHTGCLYIADSWNHRIRKINLATSTVSTFAGGGSAAGVGSTGAWIDGADTSARFFTPCGLGVDDKNNIYVADAYNHRIRKIDSSGVVTTIAGNGASGSAAGGYVDGAMGVATFNTPTEICWTARRGLLIGDTYNNCVRLVDSTGTVSTLAGNGLAGYQDTCVSNLTKFNHPRGIVSCSSDDSILIIDGANHAIRLLYKEAMPTSTHAAEDPRFSIEQKEERIVIQFSSTIDAPIQMKIVDLLGHIAPPNLSQCGNASENPTSIDISALSTGLYVLNIAYKGENISFKIIK